MTAKKKAAPKSKRTVKRRRQKQAVKRRRATRIAKPLAPPALVLAASSVPAIGKPWEGQNGIRIGEFAGENGKPGYHLLLATDDKGQPIVLDAQRWGEYGKTTGATSLNDGAANTDAMVAAGNELAKKVRGFGSDCYLPALCELQAAFAHARDLLPKEWFWSSTEYSGYGAWDQYFGSGSTGTWGKHNTYRALVVRRVPIQAQ